MQLVDHLRHRDGVDREGQATPDEHQPQQQRAGRQRGDHQSEQRGDGHHPEHHHTPFVLVGKYPDGPLQHGAAKNRHAHQQADPGRIEAHLAGVDRSQAPEAAEGEPRYAGAHQWQGGDTSQLQQVGGRHFRLHRLCLAGEGDRHQRRADQHGRQGEQGERHGAVEAQQLLCHRQRTEVNGHVEGEHLATLLAADLGIEPAFDDHVQRDQRDAIEQPQCQPDPGIDDQHVQQHHHRRHPRVEGEGANVPDATNQRRGQPGADEKAREVT